MIVHAEHDLTLHQGDALDVLPTLDAESVNCVVTSPPYYGLRDYGVDGQIGLEPTPAEYVETMRDVFAEVRRVLRPDGTLWLNLGDSYAGKANAGESYDRHRGHGHRSKQGIIPRRINNTGAAPFKSLLGMPWRVAFALVDDGWTLRNDVIWHKPNAMPESVRDRLAASYEHVFLFSRSARYAFDLGAIKVPSERPHAGTAKAAGAARGVHLGVASAQRRNGGNATSTLDQVHDDRNPGDVWTIPTQPYAAAHFATFPPTLARRCILAGCPADGVVLDPFAGAGTTLMVARQLLRRSVGIELNPGYCGLIVDRIGQAPLEFSEVTPA